MRAVRRTQLVSIPALVTTLVVALVAVGPLLDPTPAHAQEEATDDEAAKPEPRLALQSVEVLPETPGPETLCRLSVEIVNRAEQPATAFGFDVSVAGHPLPVYENQLFLKVVPPGETVELPLYNFWASETGRPAPADGKMPVEITLREARWVKVGEEEGTEVWELQGEVPGLPVSARTVVELKK
jgi:hypothetical protein